MVIVCTVLFGCARLTLDNGVLAGPPADRRAEKAILGLNEDQRLFLSRLVGRTMRDAVLGRGAYEPGYVPPSLRSLSAEVVVRLRRDGYLRAAGAGEYAAISTAARDAALATVGMLDLTDNRVGDTIVPPNNVVRHDGDDPYLVVAADKGTAAFSDIANGVSAEYGFWLGDAVAAGGSAGYDHKKMGITARGGWEAVKRHFREDGKDIQSEDFTVIGVGDMSGDVVGNGMLR